MKYGIFAVVLLFSVGCTRIDPGAVGIVVDLYGENKGVQDLTLKTGRVFYNPFTQEVFEYPTFMQHRAWGGQEALAFNSKEGACITADVGINYSIDPEKVPSLFVEFRQDIKTITDTYFRNQTRDAFNRVAGNYKAIDIFGEEKQELLDQVRLEIERRLKPRGFMIDSIGFIGSPRADDRVMSSINSVIESTQKAIEAENKIRQSTAEARQLIEEAEGKAQSTLRIAQAQAEANETIAKSLTEELIHYKLLEKWDGIAPKVLGSEAGLLMQIQE